MVKEFALTGDLPTQTTVLEASAGTGKTYTIEGLVARYVAAGWPLRKLLVVTFTRMATAELRDRVRARLVRVADHLDARLIRGHADNEDDVARLLAADTDDALVRQRYERLVEALTDFDAATISTIHGFCQQVLHGLGLTGDVDRQVTLIEDQRELIDAVVDDVLVRTYASGGDDHERLKRATVSKIVRPLIANSGITILPQSSDDPQVRARRQLAVDVVRELDNRKRLGGLLSYDDLLTRLRDALADPERGQSTRDRLRMQYDVALIDEFQDTDPIQWDILRHVFGDDGSASASRALVLIGDPKQAIYSFRGADVYAYLEATTTASQATLTKNWRSDQPLLDAYNQLFAGATLGHQHIAYREVSAASGHEDRRLVGDVGAPLRIRLVTRDTATRQNRRRGNVIYTDSARDFAARDAAAEIVRLLESGAELPDGDVQRGIAPEDIAVLARTNAEAALVQRVLRDANVPAVINGVGSVFATAAASEWLRLLEALEQPASATRARAAALTVFIGKPAVWVAETLDDDALLEDVHDLLRSWASVLRDHSVASLLQTITLQQDLPGQLLARADGERLLTDIEHIGELLHAATIAEELGTSALAGWLRERIAEAPEDVEAEDRARRLESDAEAVQVLTIHRSKGLEFPVVLCPFLWSQGYIERQVPIYHDHENNDVRSIDVGGPSSHDFEAHKTLSEREQRGEQLRLVYVALTRARHQAIVWWVPAQESNQSPLARLLFCRTTSGDANPRCDRVTSVPTDEVAEDRLGVLAARCGETMAIEKTPHTPPALVWTGRPQHGTDLAAAEFTRSVDLRWRRNSYSGITAAARDEARVASEPDQGVTDDEQVTLAPAPEGPASGTAAEEALRSVDLPLAAMRAGTDIGTFVHAVLEHTDFAAEDLASDVRTAIDEQAERRLVALGDLDVSVGLCRAIETPLGPLAADARLRDVTRSDRLDELDFELPLAGGLNPTGGVTVRAIAHLLRDSLPADDPLAAYASSLRDPAFFLDLRGYLAGSIDLVMRLQGDRFFVVDYKTNWLGSPDTPLTAWHYRPAALVAAMQHHHYPLQALLYSAALHRFLRWRLPGYSPDRHLGGVLYLFLRGMTGPDVPRVDGQPCGVFSWAPPPQLVADLSDLLDGQEVAA